jgi:endonuclease/exonuclease/phosphatase family metal-dependent hydrolase
VLARSWNLFHGNTLPPGRRAYLREMVELIAADRPDVVCLQEVPGWALGRVGAWVGMTEVPALARRPSVGPLPIPALVGRALTAPNRGLIRSAFAGQGNAVLVAPDRRVLASATLPFAAPEPRVAQRVELEGLVVVNVHVSHGARGTGELASIVDWLGDATPLVLAGDFNATPDLAGFAGTIPGSIDQVVVRGAHGIARTRIWAPSEREYGGRLLSDHAPVEATFEL